jgi:ATP-dependent RNA helicase SUPV3L1/SUV3
LKRRHHHFYLGPTNSGKTHAAIAALIAAGSGVYLAPLRLLAMEVRDRLLAVGVPCNLVTGEERIYIEGARHTASTIEMMNPDNEVDVAVIDEIQMLQDRDRGSAWTAALIGVPAQTVYVCGSEAVTDICMQAITFLGDTFDVTACSRMTALILESNSLCGATYSKHKVRDRLTKGDALVAFSRKDVLTLSARLRQWGFSVASIYGALSPEVRRSEAARFCQGQADVLVATDAIGMGLNLPIRRIIFTSITKFDGTINRMLNATEVKQIAGRAGRFGLYDSGFVNVIEDHERFHIERMLAGDDSTQLRQLPKRVQFAELESAAKTLRTNLLAPCLDYFNDMANDQNALFTVCVPSSHRWQAAMVDLHAPNVNLADKFILACAPTSVDAHFENGYFLQCLTSVDRRSVQPLPTPPFWIGAGPGQQPSPKYLEEAEILSQNLSLYAWLSLQFPRIFIEGNLVDSMRSQLTNYIIGALQTQSGYAEISRETRATPVWRKRR